MVWSYNDGPKVKIVVFFVVFSEHRFIQTRTTYNTE